jgi:hypothetical protein
MTVMRFDLEDGDEPIEIVLTAKNAARFAEFLDECQRAKEAAQQDDGWIACETRMPEEGLAVMIVDPDGDWDIARWNGDDEWFTYTRISWAPDDIKWWRPLPPLPEPPAQEHTK